jgi:hypothetical protein
MPATLARMKVLKYACLSAASKLIMKLFRANTIIITSSPHLRGTRTSKTAFSWTCQPNRKDVYPQRVNAVKNDLYVGEIQSLINQSCGDE